MRSPRRAATGNWNPDWESFARFDPVWTDKVVAMAMRPAISGALDAKTIELIGLALDASTTQLYAAGVRRHIRRALEAGATREQIIAVLQLASMQGLHSMCVAAPILVEQLETLERQKGASGKPHKKTPPKDRK
jgi:alkylhydroperoxidase/carboxymuconolactone decarboxylase family protein YurZ